jgi:hypothetical protein
MVLDKLLPQIMRFEKHGGFETFIQSQRPPAKAVS